MPKSFSQWNFSKIPVLGLVAESSASAPSSPVNGQFWYDTTANKLKIYQNGSWVTPSDGAVQSVAGKTGAVTLVKGDVGLGSVDNTSDFNKPVSTAQQSALDTKASLAGAAFTGQVTGPAPASGAAFANRDYVDSVAQGLDAKQSVKFATTGNIDFTTDGITNANADGMAGALGPGTRILVRAQTNPAENGIYVQGTTTFTRAPDMDSWSEVPGAFVFVEQGTLYADTGWVVSADQGGTLGTTAINWTQFSSAGLVTASGGLTKVGNDIRVATGGITWAMLANNAVDLVAPTVTGILPVSKGGTGVEDISQLRQQIGAIGVTTFTLPALTAGSWYDTGLFQASPIVRFYDTSTGETVYLDYKQKIAENLFVRSDVAVSANAIKMVVNTQSPTVTS